MIDIDEYVTYTVTSGDMLSQDQETMFFDPQSGDLYFIQKNPDAASADIHKITPTDADSEVEAVYVGEDNTG